jgi:hypothetical protein
LSDAVVLKLSPVIVTTVLYAPEDGVIELILIALYIGPGVGLGDFFLLHPDERKIATKRNDK